MIVLVQATLPGYRQAAFEELARRVPSLLVLYGAEYFDPSVKSATSHGHLQSAPVRNHYLFGRRLLWQSGVWRYARRASAIIVEMNPRNLTSWITVLFLRRTPRIVWGHAWSRSGRGSRSNAFRRVMRRLASAVVVYTATEAREMVADGERGMALVASNGLYPASWLKSRAVPAIANAKSRRGAFIVSSRLAATKKVDLVIRALRLLRSRHGSVATLTIVGDGPERASLVELAEQEGVAESVDFLGAIYDREELLNVYLRSAVSVHPGYAGLSLIQSLNFGCPAIVAAGELHAPEIEAANFPGACVWFEADELSSLVDAMALALREPPSKELAVSLASWSSSAYSTERIADGLQAAVEQSFSGTAHGPGALLR